MAQRIVADQSGLRVAQGCPVCPSRAPAGPVNGELDLFSSRDNVCVAFDFSYEVTGAGWSKALISDGEHRATVTASYLTDALRDLLDAVAAVAEGESESRCLWTEEPGEFRWVFRGAHGEVEIQVIEFEQTYSREPDLDGTLRFRSTQPVGLVARRVAKSAQDLFDTLGPHGYKDRWIEHPFPSDALERLSRLL